MKKLKLNGINLQNSVNGLALEKICYLISVGYDSASNVCMTGSIPADVAIIHIIIKAIGIQEKKSRFISPGYSLTSKANIANANIEIVKTISE